jgi:predicted RNA-binding protein with PIN domain
MLIIDGYNCMYAGAALGGRWDGFSLRRLCGLLEQNRAAAIVVLDGRRKASEPDADEFPGLTLIYSGRGIKADDVISKILSQRTDRRHITVVSNDRAVAADARRQKARSESCERFLQAMVVKAAAKKSGRLESEPREKCHGLAHPGETEHWLQELGVSKKLPPRLPSTSGESAAGHKAKVPSDEIAGLSQARSGKPSGRGTKPGPAAQHQPQRPGTGDLSTLDDQTIASLLGPVEPA